MKKIVFTFVCVSGLTIASFAQHPNHAGGNSQGQHKSQGDGKGNQGGQKQTPAQKSEKLTQYMTTALTLTSDQQTKVAALNTAKATEVDSIRTANKGNMESGKTALKSVKQNYNTNLKTILTTEQQTKWEELKKQKRDEMQKNKDAGKKPTEGDLTPEDLD